MLNKKSKETLLSKLKNCTLCPRECKVNRLNGELGFCKASNKLTLAKAYLHKWEEPCISGKNGSGTIFFTNCSLKCVFCQNHDISHNNKGKDISIERLSEIFLEQQQNGAHNINLVTPTHYVPQIILAIDLAREKGLSLPILYNCSGYEKVETLNLLKGSIDVYLPDFKYFDDKYAIKYSNAPNYFNFASNSLAEMVNQTGSVQFDNNGIIQKGVIVRHMLLPSLLFDSKKIVDFLYKNYKEKIYISLMNQYTPMFNSFKYPEIHKKLNPKIYDSLIDYCISIGLKNAYIQESSSSSTTFIPNFDFSGL